jgi:hypothetical protein
VTPFALRSAAQFRPDGPVAHVDERGRPNRAYVRQARDVLRDSRQLDDRTKSIAASWWDGPSTELPPGHWCLLAQYVSRRDRHSVDQDAKPFFALTGASLDASIAAWDAKRAYDSVRPITAIRELYRGRTVLAWGGPGRGTRPIRGEDWLPYQPATVVTAPFAEYLSGHSTFSAAAAEVLASFTGSRRFGLSVTIPAASSMIEPGVVPSRPVTLTFPTFDEAAEQAGRSRRYGGIHFEAGDLDGRRPGRRVGANAWPRPAATSTARPHPDEPGPDRRADQPCAGRAAPYVPQGRGELPPALHPRPRQMSEAAWLRIGAGNGPARTRSTLARQGRSLYQPSFSAPCRPVREAWGRHRHPGESSCPA